MPVQSYPSQEDILAWEQFNVREVMERESGPKGLLSKLPWKLEASCSVPGVDAVVRFGFPSLWRADLQVLDQAKRRAIYEVQGISMDQRSDPHGQDAVWHALAALVSDVEAMSKNP